MVDEPEPSIVDEHLTARQHLLKADAALTAAKEAHGKYVREMDRRSDGSTLRLAEYLDLIQMVNTHANMATAKSMLEIAERNVPVIFNGLAPGDVAQPGDPMTGPHPHNMPEKWRTDGKCVVKSCGVTLGSTEEEKFLG